MASSRSVSDSSRYIRSRAQYAARRLVLVKANLPKGTAKSCCCALKNNVPTDPCYSTRWPCKVHNPGGYWLSFCFGSTCGHPIRPGRFLRDRAPAWLLTALRQVRLSCRCVHSGRSSVRPFCAALAIASTLNSGHLGNQDHRAALQQSPPSGLNLAQLWCA